MKVKVLSSKRPFHDYTITMILGKAVSCYDTSQLIFNIREGTDEDIKKLTDSGIEAVKV